MLAPGEGVRQEDVIEGFLAMVEAWGFPQGLYLDNGSEFSYFERISHYFALMNETAGRPIIYAKAYNAKAKYIEGVFKRLDQYLFKLMPGYTGSDRMNKKTAQVGRPTQPYPGDWAAFCEELTVRLAAFNARPIGGQWAGRSADDVYASHVAARWRPITVDTLVLDAAFSKRTTRRLDRGGVKSRMGSVQREGKMGAFAGPPGTARRRRSPASLARTRARSPARCCGVKARPSPAFSKPCWPLCARC